MPWDDAEAATADAKRRQEERAARVGEATETADVDRALAQSKSARFQAAVESWLAGFEIRVWPAHAGHHYAQVRAELERKGQAIGNMDLLIAAHALAEDAVLVTNNAREFLRVPGLAVEEWSL